MAFEIIGSKIISHWKSCLRPSVQFEEDSQNDLNHRGIYGSKSISDADWELDFIFNSKNIRVQPEPPVKSRFQNVTCCVIKPHVVRQGLAGRIIEDIQMKGTVWKSEKFSVAQILREINFGKFGVFETTNLTACFH